MKPKFHLVPGNMQASYLSRQHVLPNFGTVWHYHPELEFHYIIRGEGVRFVGDNISSFEAGEMLLLGENIPHMWRCNEEYFQNNPNITAEAIVIHFLPEFLGKDFLNKPEAEQILVLFERAKKGLVITGATKKKLLAHMKNTVKTTGMKRILSILSMLTILSESEEVTSICTGPLKISINKNDTDRLTRVYDYVVANYQKEITLEEISEIANLSVTSFCRYFKMMTKKTFHEFLIHTRINQAKKMLIEDKLSTTDLVCYECGFNHLSNFYRHFRNITGLTPAEYKRKYLYENVFI
ncbi:MAG: AraC family transcriptional regulator [Pedobacter sp.]|uniref:AraC family transcriptional regulator n=1 Tax=Pedobacter sp. TaxID=1411316 RepID=UPI002807E081|nr:AraC family transcriptional regulator [Pedobacter sp.]MDQ8006062.1 AraC family transcriptional regulator [Pedobacter sp.]